MRVIREIIRYLLIKNNVELRNVRNSGVRYSFDEHYFDNIDTPNKAYILGMLYADGDNEPNYNKIKLTLQKTDREILEDIRKELKVEKPLQLYERHKKNENWQDAYEMILYSKHMCDKLTSCGCVPKKSLILQWPKWLRKDLYPHFVRGYFDGDGSISMEARGARSDFTSSRDFCEGLSKFLFQIGIYNKVNDVETNEKTAKVVINRKEETKKLFLYMYKDATLFMRRKYLSFLKKFPEYEGYCYLKEEPNFDEIDKKDKKLIEEKLKNKSAK